MMLRLAAWLMIAITVGIVIALIIPPLEFFAEVSITDFLFGTRGGASVRQRVLRPVPLITATVGRPRSPCSPPSRSGSARQYRCRNTPTPGCVAS